MAFQIQNFARVSTSGNEDIVDLINTSIIDTSSTTTNPPTYLKTGCVGCFRRYQYLSKTWTGATTATLGGDSHSVIDNPGYFNAIANDLQPGDLIDAHSAVDRYTVTYKVVTTKIVSNGTEIPNVTIAPVSGSSIYRGFFSNAIINALNTTPQLLVKGVPDSIIVPSQVLAYMAPGTAYTGGTNVALYYNTQVYSTIASGTGTNSIFGANGGVAITQPSTTTTLALFVSAVGADLKLSTLTSSVGFAGGSSPLFVMVNYSIYPVV